MNLSGVDTVRGTKIRRLNNLRAIDLSRNKLSRPIPSEIGSCMLLKSVDLSENSLSGNLADTFQQLSLCYYLNLGSNVLEGEVPKWVGEMRSLESLDLSMNNLPDSTGNCINLMALDVSGNSLTGKLPVWIFDDDSTGGVKKIQVEKKLKKAEFASKQQKSQVKGNIPKSAAPKAAKMGGGGRRLIL
ncbi:hypothetical protein YC2023_095113 [Brassica napus]